jgi:hypothetical protein
MKVILLGTGDAVFHRIQSGVNVYGSKNVVLTHLRHNSPPHDEAVKQWPFGYDGMDFVL